MGISCDEPHQQHRGIPLLFLSSSTQIRVLALFPLLRVFGRINLLCSGGDVNPAKSTWVIRWRYSKTELEEATLDLGLE